MNVVAAMKIHFITVLYNDTNDVNKSRYLVKNTNANKHWLLPDIPKDITNKNDLENNNEKSL